MSANRKRIGIALGGGSARGLSHIGILSALNKMGIKPDIVCGTSMGALVGAAYASGHLDDLEKWVLSFTNLDIVRYLDISLAASGGFADAHRLLDYCRSHFGDPKIEELGLTYVAVAAELDTGNEVYLKEGSLWDAVRAAITMPGLLTPIKSGQHWLVDGGIVNPVPVSLCRELGADEVIAVIPLLDGNNNSQPAAVPNTSQKENVELSLLEKLTTGLKGRRTSLYSANNNDAPGVFEVIARSLHIMQDRITRNRLTGDAPDIILLPEIAHIGLMEFDRARDAIAAGHHCIENNQAVLKKLLNP